MVTAYCIGFLMLQCVTFQLARGLVGLTRLLSQLEWMEYGKVSRNSESFAPTNWEGGIAMTQSDSL